MTTSKPFELDCWGCPQIEAFYADYKPYMVWNDEKSSNEVERGQLNWILLDSNVVTTTTTVHLSTIFKLFELDR